MRPLENCNLKTVSEKAQQDDLSRFVETDYMYTDIDI